LFSEPIMLDRKHQGAMIAQGGLTRFGGAIFLRTAPSGKRRFSVQRSGCDLVLRERPASAIELPFSRFNATIASSSDDPLAHRRYADCAVSSRSFSQ